jgi:folate-binding protein YgfZ
MDSLKLHLFHEGLGARFAEVNGTEVVADYGNSTAEYQKLNTTAGVFDLSFRGRLCLTGGDRARFLHGQVTNDIKRLRPGEGCYAALVTAKGKMQSDLNVFCLADELLLDFEPGLVTRVTQRLEQYVVADEVQVVEVSHHYGLLSVQGPSSTAVVQRLQLFDTVPSSAFGFSKLTHPVLGEVYLVKHGRLGTDGFDLFVPVAALETVAERLIEEAKKAGGAVCGWTAFETTRVEAGIPRYGVDMDESHLPQECGIEARAVSFSKGCYIGQEVLNRLHTLGHVNRHLCGLVGEPGPTLPQRGAKLIHDGRECGFVTSAVHSPHYEKQLFLGYVRREASAKGTRLSLLAGEGQRTVTVSDLPFRFG